MTQQVSQSEVSIDWLEIDAVERDRRIVAISTLMWWKRAHIERHPHHERFPGYCVVCRQEAQHD